MKNLVYEQSIYDCNKAEIGKNELHEFLFYPTAESIVSYIAEGIKQKDPSFQFFSKRESWSVLNHIVQSQFNQSFGTINLQHTLKAIEEVGQTWEYIQFLKKSEFKGCIVSSEIKDNIVGYGILTEDYQDSDNDPYPTAGGYRIWKANAGEIVQYRLNKDLSITISFVSNCLVDHYNNNFAGVSTGNGTTEYKEGERTANRFVKVDSKGVFWENWTKMPIQTKPTEICKENLHRLLKEYQSELYEVC